MIRKLQSHVPFSDFECKQKLRSIWSTKINPKQFIIFLVLLFCLWKFNRPNNNPCRLNISIITVYNRVPKCGSSLMNTLLRLSSNGGERFEFIQSEDYEHFRLSSDKQNQLNYELINQTEKPGPRAVVYERHLYFINFPPKPNVMYYYINQIRDPLTRVLSSYDYIRYICHIHGPNGTCPWINRNHTNVTMEQCVSTGDPARCISPQYGVLSAISFFCGQSAICDDSSEEFDPDIALMLAKVNIERHYAFVGVLEYLESSLELLEYTQPNLFGGILENYRVRLSSRSVHETPRSFRRPISEKTRLILTKLLKHEYELYYFIRDRFSTQYSRMFHRQPRSDPR